MKNKSIQTTGNLSVSMVASTVYACILPHFADFPVLSYTESFAAPHRKGNCSQVAVDLNSLNMLEKEIRTTWPSYTLKHIESERKSYSCFMKFNQ